MSPGADDVRRQLDRLLASSVFANAGRMSRFLKFVVEETLAGDGDRLKEYVIGVEVFDRDAASYDPRIDSIVRVEAARLRTKLAEYYAGEGRDDSVILSLPKGGYAPLITLDERPKANGGGAANGGAAVNGAASHAAAHEQPRLGATVRGSAHGRRWVFGLGAAGAVAAALAVFAWAPSLAPVPQLRVAVLPFAVDAGDAPSADLAARLTEGVTAELVRTARFAVVASSAARTVAAQGTRPRDVAAALAADFVVEARVTTDGDLVHVEARAADGRLERKLWVDGFAGTVANTDSLEREIATALAAALGAAEIVLPP